MAPYREGPKLWIWGRVADGMALLGKRNFLVAETTVAKIVRWFVFSD